ncbi:MAG: hypothetical protein L3J83_08615 [Proteobacteria bacterium]|nr:hypothetical protein [Pseudomonadota bacterium]
MKRRNFTQSLLTGLSISCMPMGISMATKSPVHELLSRENLATTDGLKLKLTKQIHPTKNKDKKQFVLTYDVKNNVVPLEEKIYDLKLANDKTHQVYMTPVTDNQLQAVFNLRLNA